MRACEDTRTNKLLYQISFPRSLKTLNSNLFVPEVNKICKWFSTDGSLTHSNINLNKLRAKLKNIIKTLSGKKTEANRKGKVWNRKNDEYL